jgi:hypothetical protein
VVAIGVLPILRCSNGFFWLFRALLCNQGLEYSKRTTRTILRLAEAICSWGCEVAVVLEAQCCVWVEAFCLGSSNEVSKYFRGGYELTRLKSNQVFIIEE